MARVFGGNADFYLEDTWIEPWLDSITMNFDVPTADITAFLDDYQNVVAGKKNVTIELSGEHDTAASAADEVIFSRIGSGVAISKFEPTGSTDYYYRCADSTPTGTLVTSYSISLPVGDKASFTASLQNSGATTRETS